MGLRDFELITLSTDLPEDQPRVQKFLEKQRAGLPGKLESSLKQEGRKSNNYIYTEASMDALIYASAMRARVQLVTCDARFEGLPQADYRAKLVA